MKKILFAVAAAVALFVGPVLVSPMASADTLPNGYSVTCAPQGDSQVLCEVSGCPRVYDVYAGDAVHVRINALPQLEDRKACNDADPVIADLSPSSTFTLSVQGCRKNIASSDDCGAWSTYTYTPPAQPQAPAQAPVMSNAGEPVLCTVGDYKLPPGSDCFKTPNPNPPPAPVPDVTNAIQASFGQPGLKSIDFNVTNTSNLDATCHYTATANSLNPVVPKNTTRQFNVPAKQNVVQTFNGVPTLTNYSVTLSCNDASGKQKAELGHVDTSVLW